MELDLPKSSEGSRSKKRSVYEGIVGSEKENH